MFSPGGEGFMRLNVGTSRTILEKAMQRLLSAVHLTFKPDEGNIRKD
jgi:cystathionine beta-lyase